jgi:hypothetical protein
MLYQCGPYDADYQEMNTRKRQEISAPMSLSQPQILHEVTQD